MPGDELAATCGRGQCIRLPPPGGAGGAAGCCGCTVTGETDVEVGRSLGAGDAPDDAAAATAFNTACVEVFATELFVTPFTPGEWLIDPSFVPSEAPWPGSVSRRRFVALDELSFKFMFVALMRI